MDNARDFQFNLQFPLSQVAHWAARYEVTPLETEIEQVIVPRARAARWLNFDHFLKVCYWKTPRSQSRCKSNDPAFLRSVTETAFSTESERLRVEVLTLLSGVGWPTASVLLHWIHEDSYPIFDVRALWSLGNGVPDVPNFAFWWAYAEYCRGLATRAGVSMRQLDRALWQYSKEHQDGLS